MRVGVALGVALALVVCASIAHAVDSESSEFVEAELVDAQEAAEGSNVAEEISFELDTNADTDTDADADADMEVEAAKDTPAKPAAKRPPAPKPQPKPAVVRPPADVKKPTPTPPKPKVAVPTKPSAPTTKAPSTAGPATVKAAATKKASVVPKGSATLKTVKKYATIAGVSIEEKEYQRHFSEFMRKHKRVYKAEDMTKRYAQYKSNWLFVNSFNKFNHDKPDAVDNASFKLATNQFADHSQEEYKKKLGFRSARIHAPDSHAKNAKIMEGHTTEIPNGAKHEAYKKAAANDVGVGKPGEAHPSATAPAASASAPAKPRFKEIPASKNWADDPTVVAPIRMQGQCGSCWSFVTTAVVESANAILTGTLAPSAPQHILDCADKTNWAPCDGCNGGDIMTAFRFVAQNGLCAWSDYPYTGVAPAPCKPCTAVNWISGGTIVAQNGDEVSALSAIANGPVATAVMANLQTFQFYSSGVYNDPACPTDFGSLDHAVALVGYGTTDDGQDYWWLRNQWDTTWGEKGYMRIARGKNMCGVALEIMQPTAVLNPNGAGGSAPPAATDPAANANANANGSGNGNGNGSNGASPADSSQPPAQPTQPTQPSSSRRHHRSGSSSSSSNTNANANANNGNSDSGSVSQGDGGFASPMAPVGF